MSLTKTLYNNKGAILQFAVGAATHYIGTKIDNHTIPLLGYVPFVATTVKLAGLVDMIAAPVRVLGKKIGLSYHPKEFTCIEKATYEFFTERAKKSA